MKIGAIIQARMGSTRLPEKIMMELNEKTVLKHVIDRVKLCSKLDEIIIATTNSVNDDLVFEKALEYGSSIFRGSEDDVLERYYQAALMYNLDVIVRITSDCPLIDPNVIDQIISAYINSEYDIVSNAGDEKYRTFPRGLDTEVFSVQALDKAYLNADKEYQREHVTPYLYENMEVFYYMNDINYSQYRWTLDTKDDYKLISEIYRHLYKGEHDFFMSDIIDLFEKNSNLIEINKNIKQKSFG